MGWFTNPRRDYDFEREIEARRRIEELRFKQYCRASDEIRKAAICVPVLVYPVILDGEEDQMYAPLRVIERMSKFDLWHHSVFPTDGYMHPRDLGAA